MITVVQTGRQNQTDGEVAGTPLLVSAELGLSPAASLESVLLTLGESVLLEPRLERRNGSAGQSSRYCDQGTPYSQHSLLPSFLMAGSLHPQASA